MVEVQKSWNVQPQKYQITGTKIEVTTATKTDFWRKTHYDFIRDNGHFYSEKIQGDYIAQVKVTGQYKYLYDQAGLMIRVDESNWIKCGIEFVENVQQVSAVITRDFSDWSVRPLLDNPEAIWIRIKRNKTTVEVEYSLDQQKYFLLRLGYLVRSEQGEEVGIMCCSPDGPGFDVTFEDFQLQKL